jgi:N6-L-threonylcarbamoyladenine synthase
MNEVLILAIESSCDETSVAVVKNGTEILSNIVASQINSHKRFGGVVPEIASRHHVEQITLCINDALA